MSDLAQTLLFPDWPAPASVRACVTTRQGGVSLPPYATFNLGDHVGMTLPRLPKTVAACASSSPSSQPGSSRCMGWRWRMPTRPW